MSLRRTYAVACDGCAAQIGGRATAKDARAAARKARWKRVAKNGRAGEAGLDYCPRCTVTTIAPVGGVL